MKIEAGKYYMLANGVKAFVVGKTPTDLVNTDMEYWLGISFDDTHTWAKDGSHNLLYERIVAEWVEPMKEGEPDEWLYIDIDRDGDAHTLHSSKEFDECRDDPTSWLKIPAYRVDNG